MRSYLIAAGFLSLAAPAAAQPYPDAPPYPDDVVDSLPSPREYDEMGVAMERVVGAMMDIPVGGLIEAIEPGRRLSEAEREQTVGDMARRDDPYVEERLRGSIGAMTANMGLMTEQLAVLLPVLRESMADIERRMEDAIGPYRRDWDE